MDCSHLPQTDPTPNLNPDPNPNPNPYLDPQSHNRHPLSSDSNASQYYTTTPADPNNIMFLPQFQSQQPNMHSPYAPPPASVGYVPFVRADSYAAASYYPDPSVNSTSAVGHYVPGASGYAAVNGVVANLHQNTTSQKQGTKKKKKKKTKDPVPHAWCDVCKIDCTSKDVLELHRLGKKHKKNLEKLKSTGIGPIIAYHPPPPLSAPSPAAVTHPPPEIATSILIIQPQVSSPGVAASTPIVEPQVSSPMIAASTPIIEPQVSSPKVAASTPIIEPQLSSPMIGASSPHTDKPVIGLQVSSTAVAPSPPKTAISTHIVEPQVSSPMIAPSSPLLGSNPTSPRDKPSMGPQVPPTVTAAVSSTPLSVSALSTIEKPIVGPQVQPTTFTLSPPMIATSNSLPASNPTSPRDKPVIGPQVPPTVTAVSSTPLPVSTPATTEKPVIGPQVEEVRVSSCKSSKKRGRTASIEEFEMKRRKVLESGTAAEDMHVCEICNVVCNSETVLKSHLAGRKHTAAAMKKLASTGVATTT